MEASQDRCSSICRIFHPQKHRWIKKFVFHCTIFNIYFVYIQKQGGLGTRLIRKKPFLSESDNCSASDRLGRNFPTVQNGPEKRKNLYLIKLVSNWKRAIKKEHTTFLFFSILVFEIGSNWFSIKFCIRKSNSFFQKCRRGNKKKQANLKIRVKIFLKWLLWSIATKLENVATKIFYGKLVRNCLDEIEFLKFDLWF